MGRGPIVIPPFGTRFALLVIAAIFTSAVVFSATGPPTTVASGGLVRLDSTATDPEGGDLTNAWSGAEGRVFADASDADATPPMPASAGVALSPATHALGLDAHQTPVEPSAGLISLQRDTNTAPEFPAAETGTRRVAENTAAGEDIGSPVAATDNDNDTLSYSISGADAASFEVVPSSGQLQTRAALDRESRSSYTFMLLVHDGKDADGNPSTLIDDTIEVTVTVGDVDEQGTLVLSHGAPRVGSVQRARLNEEDAGVADVTWRWYQSADQQAWTRIQGANSHDFEPGSSLEGLYLRTEVRYRDKHGAGKTAEVIATASVAAAETAPTITVVELVTGLSIPWGIAFAPDGTMLFTERPGTLSSRLTDGAVQAVTADLGDLFVDAEVGLMGIVVDPVFASNRSFYTCQSYRTPRPPQHPTHLELRVIGWTLDASYTEGTRVSDPLVEGIPFGNRNTGCRLRFGPDGYLWVTTGDAGNDTGAQDLTSLGGKVLRVDASTGLAAPGNPFAPSLVYSYGHRNPQGLALRPGTRQMWSVEHGPDWDDEINLLVSGGNYGWQHADTVREQGVMTDLKRFPDAIEARWSSGSETIATSGGIFLEGDDWGIWEGRLAVASLKNMSLRLFEFDADGVLLSEHVVGELKDAHGRLRTPMMGPNGALYISTSGGGGSDKILMVAPSQPPSFPNDSVTLDVQENSAAPTVVGTVTATDPEGQPLTYTLSGPDADAFNIPNPSAGQLQARESFDHETKDSYEVVLKASDKYGLSDSVTVTINVTNVNEAPEFPSTEDGMRSVPENMDAGQNVGTPVAADDADYDTLTYSITSGADLFDINTATGQLLTKASFNHEEAPSHTITVGVSDRKDASNMAEDPPVVDNTISVEVTVVDVDEPQHIEVVWTGVGVSVNGSELTLDENYNGSFARLGATDPENEPGLRLSWFDHGTDHSELIQNELQNLWFANTPDFEMPADSNPRDNVYEFTVSVNDSNGLTGNIDLRVTVLDVNETPEFPSTETRMRSVPEDAVVGANVGSPVVALDPDGDTLTYSLIDITDSSGASDNTIFTVVEDTGQIQVAGALDADTPATASYSVTVQVSDQRDSSDVSRPDPSTT